MDTLIGLKKPLYAPMLSTFGGGSIRGFKGSGGGGGAPVMQDIFGTAQYYTYGWDNTWTTSHTHPDNWGDIAGSQGHFLSYFQPTALTPSAWNTAYSNGVAQMGTGTNATALRGGATKSFNNVYVSFSSGYNANDSLYFYPGSGTSGAGDGIWFEQNDSRTAEFTLNSGGLDNATGFLMGNYDNDGGYHKCLVIQITANSVSRLFAPHHSIQYYSGSYNIYHYLPLNSSFTSFADSRLTSYTGHTLQSSYFEYHY